MLRFFLLFVVLLAALFGLELTPWAQAWFVDAVDQCAGVAVDPGS